jgi:cyclopropane fatty-acyl-phospholipid synthase-like methyltransferase
MMDEHLITKNIIKSYSENIGFPVYTVEELKQMYEAFHVDPQSTDRRVFDTESMSHHTQAEVLKLLRMLDVTDKDYILDAGCGNGAPTRLIAKLYGCKMIGFDINPNQIRKAIDCDVLEGVDHLIERKVKNVHTLDFQKESFDKIFHNETMCHWMDKKAALTGLHEALKKNGIMGFHDWIRGEKGSLNDAPGDFLGTYAEGVWFQISMEETRSLLEKLGFNLLHSEDTTDIVDRGLRTRLRELQMSKVYLKGASEEYFYKSVRYFKVMIETHYDYLKYARFLCVKK